MIPLLTKREGSEARSGWGWGNTATLEFFNSLFRLVYAGAPAQTWDMPFIDINDYEPIELVPGAKARTPYGENVMLSYLELEEGAVIPFHKHPHEQAGMLLKGNLELTIGDHARLCTPGDMFIIPPNTPHSAKPVDGPATVLDVFSPVREDYAARSKKKDDTE